MTPATVLRVNGRDAAGRPKACEIVHDDETIDLRTGSREFLVAFVKEDCLQGSN